MGIAAKIFKKNLGKIFGEVLVVGIIILSATSCNTVRYCSQAVSGHLEILSKARPIPKVIAELNKDLEDAKDSEELRDQLLLVGEILAFARDELDLDAGGSYSEYADLGREYAVWNAFGAPEFSVKPLVWRYPIVGKLAYRGFFDESEAEAFAASLSDAGHDAFSAGIDAYSTLGWFNDPVLNTFIDRSELSLVALICHELAHQKLYFTKDASLSEAFAMLVQQEAVERWIEQGRGHSSPSDLADSRRKIEVSRRIQKLMSVARSDLSTLYQRQSELGDEELRLRKARYLATLRQRCLAEARTISEKAANGWDEIPLNNARLAASGTYHGRVPELRALLEEECEGDLPTFYLEAKRRYR